MRLYSTTTSERASKGQGGNDYIEIELKAEHGKDDYRFYARLRYDLFIDSKGQKHFRLYFQPENDKGYHELLKHLVIETKTKGNKQKGESKDCGTHAIGTCPDNCMYRNY